MPPSISEQKFSHASLDANRGTLRIAETFRSRQGEGMLAGTESFFIRTSGCNLRCWFCDTRYASWEPTGPRLTLKEVIAAVDDSAVEHVVITGGEPMLSPMLTPLCKILRESNHHVTIETAGTLYRDVECDLLSISPKFHSSAPSRDSHERWHELHHQRRLPIGTMKSLIRRADDFQIKFVVDSSDDYGELLETVRRLRIRHDRVWVMPQGVTLEAIDTARQWLEPWSLDQGFRYCDRHQIRWYGNRRGT